MTGLETVDSMAVCTRVMQIFIASFFYIFLIAKLVGPENKLAWFRKRKKYTFFNRRGIFGEDINFGYPVTWQGILVFFAIYGVIFGVGYWYVFVHAY
ncbi:hypothetical protein [uncultured Phascolarctobacterium sp.]|uniref:hypothetical protein n=1 Tax=uncultured Phascolarctobacterium sp. TaxID=512296 RepID=UPI00262069AB|nr:hypothetical protein [uncultured Phascolarctobacterium sp.]